MAGALILAVMPRRFVTGLLLCVAAALAVATWGVQRGVAAATGLTRRFYATADLQGEPRAEAVAAGIDLAFLDDDPALPRRFFSVRWEGYWDPGTDGPIDLYAGADDWLRISVDDRLVLERSPQLGQTTIRQALPAAGTIRHLVVEYGQQGGGARVGVQWAPAGGAPRPIRAESLFRAPPTDSVRTRARWLPALTVARNVAAIAAGAALALFFVVPAGRRAWRQQRVSGSLTRTSERVRVIADRAGRPAFVVLAIAAIAWTVWLRWPGLDPKTLWADDVWLASITKLPLGTALAAPAPVPPGFVAALKGARQVIADPEVSLQLVPFLAGLAGALLAGLLAARLTGRRSIGLVALALTLASPFLAHYSIFVKQYSVDFAVTAGMLLAGVTLVDTRRVALGRLSAAAVVAALVSIPSVFVSVPLVHLAALARAWREHGNARWRTAGIVLAFDLLLAAIYVFWLADRSNPALTAIWRQNFLPLSSLGAAWEFLATNGAGTLADALPERLSGLTALAGVGLVALVARRDTRMAGLVILLALIAVLAASALGRYPIGTDFLGRTVIFSYALTIVLVAAGVHTLLRWLPGHRVLCAGAAAVALAWLVVVPLRVTYFPLDHVDLVRELESRAGAPDAIVLNTSGAYLAGYYAAWEIEAFPDDSPQGFGVRLRRPLSITLPRGAEEGDRPLSALVDLLTAERPARAFFFSTRRGFAAVEAAFAAHGYVEVRRTTSTVSTVLIEYARSGP
jgi:hypothetical protein